MGAAIDDFVKQKCGLIVTVGGLMADSTVEAAKRHPAQRFLITEAGEPRGLSNLVSVTFATDQAAFLAGYLAAGTTRTGKVATFGGIPISPVISFMNGFAAGVLYYNRLHGKKVQLLGWNAKTQQGTFVSSDPTDFGAFGDVAAAAHITTYFVSAEADIIMPVDGAKGEQGAGWAAQRAKGVLLIGVDTDQRFSTPQYSALWLTSVLKRYRRMVYLAIGDVVKGKFTGGVLRGTLATGGVRLAPF